MMSEHHEKITPMYARHGSAAFNAALHDMLRRLTQDAVAALGENLVALILGGGYGRGEGGVLRVEGQELPYNDLDLVLIVEDPGAIQSQALTAISEKYEQELKIHVDFSRPFAPSEIREWPTTLMWQDLVNGHIVLHGSADALTNLAPESLQKSLGMIEATRLLLNRGEGLLWAMHMVRGYEPVPDEDIVRRNYHKCGLALGDALLIMARRYTTAYTGRDALVRALLEDLPELARLGIMDVYEPALAFKFQPADVPAEQPSEDVLSTMAALWGAVYLHIERRRTGQAFTTLDEYCRWKGIREADEHVWRKWPRNSIRSWQYGLRTWRYPREFLYRRLPVLLELTDATARDWDAETAQFIKLWERFNG